MAWFLNHYRCARCRRRWSDEWSCTCDDDCPHCGARHMSPMESDDLTEVVEPRGGLFVALRSPSSAGHSPDYEELGVFSTERDAETCLANLEVG